MKLILIKSTQLDIFISKFRSLIQSWKIWKKHQNNKFGYGIQAFPEINVLIPYHPNSMFNNIIPLFSCQNWSLKNSPMINSNSNGDKNYVN
jgi:hypothetical protein